MHAASEIDAYIRSEPVHARKALRALRALIRKAAPQATEKLAWGMPTFHQEGNLLHFAAFKNHLSLFPGTDAVARFREELARHVSPASKGTIQIPYGKSLPAALVTRIVKFCVKRNLADAAARKKAKAARAASR